MVGAGPSASGPVGAPGRFDQQRVRGARVTAIVLLVVLLVLTLASPLITLLAAVGSSFGCPGGSEEASCQHADAGLRGVVSLMMFLLPWVLLVLAATGSIVAMALRRTWAWWPPLAALVVDALGLLVGYGFVARP